MRSFGKWLGRVLAVLAVLAVGLWVWPREVAIAPPMFNAAALPDDLDSWLVQRESVFSDITPGTQKRIVWAGEPTVKTPLA
ncbi:MAG: alpha/beta hydrolase, partial [Gemmobacter sp.]|nr:alpha/beta hydrolase [Gemmobacter sp.]